MDNKFSQVSYNDLKSASLEAINWIASNKSVETKLNDEAKALHFNLCNLITESEFAKEIASTQVQTVGVFGASQAGKSFLVSRLAANKDGDFKAHVNNFTFDFIQHLNPVGNDTEATGIATRFKHQNVKIPNNYSFLVKVFTEVDVAMLLLNSFLYDLEDASQSLVDENTLNNLLDSLKAYIDEKAENYIEPQHIIEFATYYNQLNKLKDPLLAENSKFFYEASFLLPKLNLEGRTLFFSFFFNNLFAYQVIYKELSEKLLKLKGKTSIYIPKEAFLEADGSGYKQKALSLNNIGAIVKLFDGNETIKVALDEEAKEEIDFPFYHLAALTYELVFPVENGSDFDNFDVIDFPGARNRGGHSISTLAKSQSDLEQNEKRLTILDFVRRGKVGFIFDKYSRHKSLDLLILCLGVNQQAEVTGLGSILKPWVLMNIGQDEAKRDKLKDAPPLIGVLTRFDECLNKVYFEPSIRFNRTDADQDTFDKFLNDATRSVTNSSWFKNFDLDSGFNNFFITRNTRVSKSFPPNWIEYDKASDKEIEITTDAIKESLNICKEKLVNSAFFLSHVQKDRASREKLVDALYRANDGGISLIVDKFKTAYTEDKRDTRIYEPLQERLHSLIDGLSKYANKDVANQREKALAKASFITNSFVEINSIAPIFTKIRRDLELDFKDISSDYNYGSYDNANAYAFAISVIQKYKGLLENLKSERTIKFLMKIIKDEMQKKKHRIEYEKSKYTFFYKDKELTTLKTEAELSESLFALIKDFVEEIEKAINVLDLNSVLAQILLPNEKDDATSGASRKFIQVRQSVDFISNFNHSLGQFLSKDKIANTLFDKYTHNTIKDSDIKATVFRPEFSLSEDLPILNDTTKQYAFYYLTGFLSSFKDLVIDKNTNYQVKFNFSQEANQDLLNIITNLEHNAV